MSYTAHANDTTGTTCQAFTVRSFHSQAGSKATVAEGIQVGATIEDDG